MISESLESRGFLVVAENNNNIDFLEMAYTLALSLQISQSKYKKLSIITTDTNISDKYIKVFDKIITVKKDNDWKNKSKSLDTTSLCASYYEHTPYDETIVLDADFIFLNDISEWWDMFDEDLIFTYNVRTFRNEPITSNHYRKVFTDNNLPNIYTGMFYFKKGKISRDFFQMVNIIFNNWEIFFNELESKPLFLSADVAYAIAYKLLELPDYSYKVAPKFIHMKTRLQNIRAINETWTEILNTSFMKNKLSNESVNTLSNESVNTLSNETVNTLSINNFNITLPFHYHDKNFLTKEYIEHLENILR